MNKGRERVTEIEREMGREEEKQSKGKSYYIILHEIKGQLFSKYYLMPLF